MVHRILSEPPYSGTVYGKRCRYLPSDEKTTRAASRSKMLFDLHLHRFLREHPDTFLADDLRRTLYAPCATTA